MQKTEKPRAGVGRPNSVAHSQTPGKLGRQGATWVFITFSKAGGKNVARKSATALLPSSPWDATGKESKHTNIKQQGAELNH